MSCVFNEDDGQIPGKLLIGGLKVAVATATLNYIAQETDFVIIMAAAHNVTLPDATTVPGQIFTVKFTSASGTCVVGTFAGNIEGISTYTLSAQYKYVTVVSDGTDYWIIANN